MFVFIEEKYSHIECDEPGCTERSPSPEELLEGHGLVNMGWHCAGGRHYCPRHAAAGVRR